MTIDTTFKISDIDQLITLIKFSLVDDKNANHIAESFFKIKITQTNKDALIEKIDKFRTRLESANYNIAQTPETYYKRLLSGEITN